MAYESGTFIRFTYTGAKTLDNQKEVLVLHPNWMGEVHAIDLMRLTQAEREVLRAILDPKTKRPHKLPLVNDVLNRMTPWEDIKNPVSFYSQFVKPFLRNKDAYRRYLPERMSGITVVEDIDVSGAPIAPAKPLFGKPGGGGVFGPK